LGTMTTATTFGRIVTTIATSRSDSVWLFH